MESRELSIRRPVAGLYLNAANVVSEKSKVTVNADSAKFKCLREETLFSCFYFGWSE